MSNSVSNRVLTGLAVLSIIAIIWYLLQLRQQYTQKHAQTPAQVQQEDTQNKTQALQQSKQTKESSDWTSKYAFIPEQDVNALEPEERTVLKIYKDLSLARECLPYYREQDRNTDQKNMAAVLERHAVIQNGSGARPTNAQYAVFKDFMEHCLILKAAVFRRVGIEKEFPQYGFLNPVVVELQKELDSAEAKTEEEHELLEVFKLKAEFGAQYKALRKSIVGENLLTNAEMIKLSNEISQLFVDMTKERMARNFEKVTEIEAEIKDKTELLMAKSPVENSQREEIIGPFLQLTEDLKKYLHSPFPYSFEETISILETDSAYRDFFSSLRYDGMLNYLPEYITPWRELQVQTDIRDKDVLYRVIEPALILYLCHLGDDCGVDSSHMRKYCLGNGTFWVSYEAACGMDVMQFYTEYFLSQNQKKEVFAMLDLMVEFYAL